MIETRLLQYFLAIAEEQNITRAAESLHITQPTLSKQMMDLEAQVGRPLLIRGHKKTLLTEDGLFLRNKAQEIIELLEKTENAFRKCDMDTAGDVFIGCGEFHSIGPVMELISGISADYPDIHFHFSSGDAVDILEKLDRGLLDFAFLLDPELSDRYDSYRLPLKERWSILIRKDDPLNLLETVTLRDLEKRRILVPSRYTHNQTLQRQLTASGFKPQIAGTFNLVYNAGWLVSKGVAPALCLESLILSQEDLVHRIIEPEICSDIYLFSKKHQAHSRAASLFLREMENEGLIPRQHLRPEKCCHGKK